MAYVETPNTCRFCHGIQWHDQGVKYGTRHYAHFACYLDAGKKLADLQKWQIGTFPFRLLRERGLMAQVERLTSTEEEVRHPARRTLYDLCHELNDGTIDKPLITYTNKRKALRIARIVAKNPISDVMNVLVIDRNEDIAVAVFPLPQEGG
jgi:hypothetical protein